MAQFQSQETAAATDADYCRTPTCIIYENNGACACVGGGAAWRTAHAITFLPPTACNYYIVHDAEIKFLLLLSNARRRAGDTYNLKIQIALPPH